MMGSIYDAFKWMASVEGQHMGKIIRKETAFLCSHMNVTGTGGKYHRNDSIAFLS
jgi:hypothetical protein